MRVLFEGRRKKRTPAGGRHKSGRLRGPIVRQQRDAAPRNVQCTKTLLLEFGGRSLLNDVN